MVQLVPIPIISAWDPLATSSGSIDPLGALRPFNAIATTILPGVTTITTRIRYLSWVCSGLRLLDEIRDAPSGGRAGRVRRERVLRWERIVALATGMYAAANELAADDDAWRKLRGVTYVQRALKEGVRSSAFPLLVNQAGVGGIGTYWVTMVAGGLVEDTSGALTPRGEALADAFLKCRSTPDRAKLCQVLVDNEVSFSEATLISWGEVTHLGAAATHEQGLLADALLEPEAHRRMAEAMQATNVAVSNADTFVALEKYLHTLEDRLANQLVSVLAVTRAFEALHSALLHQFDMIRSTNVLGHPVPIASIQLASPGASLSELGDGLLRVIDESSVHLSTSVAHAVRSFRQAVEPVCKAKSDPDIVEALVRHHERVQSGKLDASRQPKLPWVEHRGKNVVVAPRYALTEPPQQPKAGSFTHPYRVEQFREMLAETGIWVK